MLEPEMGFDEAFRTGLIANESSEQLQKRLMDLCTGHIPNESVRHREIIRGITINHILLQRHIDKLNKQNTILQRVVIILAGVAIITGIFQIYTQSKYSRKPQYNSMQQVAPKSEEANSKRFQDEMTKADQGKNPSKPLNTYGK